MKKILLFSFFLMLGLVVSQFLPAMVGEGYSSVKTISNTLLYVCLAFIMINVGREFEMDKSRWRSYTEDYFIAMATAVSFLFMFLVGVSMPVFFGVDFAAQSAEATTITGAQPMMSWPVIILHVVIVSFLSNIGKLFPLFFYRERRKRERLALSIGMFTRGEVGAGIIFIALGYNLGGPALMISVLTIVFNLILTGIFVVWVEKLTRSAYELEQAGK